MGAANEPVLTPRERYTQFKRVMQRRVESANIMIAVDFSQSNIYRASGWGSVDGKDGSLHCPGKVTDQEDIKHKVQSPYRRAIELIGEKAFDYTGE